MEIRAKQEWRNKEAQFIRKTRREIDHIRSVACTCALCEEEESEDQLKFRFSAVTLIICILFLAMCLVFGCARNASSDIVRIAQEEIGNGEIGGDNKGPIVKKYTKGKEVAWCAGFVSYVLEKSGKKITYSLFARNFLGIGQRTDRPKPGDLIVFSRGNGRGHVGIIEDINDEEIKTIEGNVGDYPAKVKRLKYQRNNIPNLLGFVHIE